MLYVSTRNKKDSYTAHRALHEERAPDGGFYLPFHLPVFSLSEFQELRSCSFGDIIARVLNLFFSTKLSGWDVEFCCGRYPLKNINLPRRLNCAEVWHNTASSYRYLELALYRKLTGNTNAVTVTEWAKIAIRIAVITAVYCCDLTGHETQRDLAVDGEGYIALVAAWYARKMGLPIGTIICGCCDSSAAWDLIHRGELSAYDASCEGLERLVYITLGAEESANFIAACAKKRPYHLTDEQRLVFCDGLFAAVVSSERIPSVIHSFYRSHDYILDEAAAVAFGALQDYQSRTGESKQTVMILMDSPVNSLDKFSALLGISAEKIRKSVNSKRG